MNDPLSPVPDRRVRRGINTTRGLTALRTSALAGLLAGSVAGASFAAEVHAAEVAQGGVAFFADGLVELWRDNR